MSKLSIKQNRYKIDKHKSVFEMGKIIALLAILGTLFAYAGASCNNIIPAEHNSDHNRTPDTFYDNLEYNRHLKRVVISLSVNDTTLNLHDNLILALPEYTNIIVLLPITNLPVISRELQEKPYGGRTILVPFNVAYEKQMRTYLFFPEENKLLYGDTEDERPIPFGTVWAQDLFETITVGEGKRLLLISDAHKWFSSVGDRTDLNISSDNAYLEGLFAVGVDIKRSQLIFDGGNILIDELGGKRLVFSGGDMLRNTNTVWKATRDFDPTDAQIIKLLKESFDADEVVILGRDRVQPSLMFHLDQAMVFLSDGTVGLTNIVGEYPKEPSDIEEIQEAEELLSEIRSALSELGYKIINVDTSVENILNHQHYVNAIPYVDIETKQRTLLMPVFSAGQFGESLEKKNIAAFESVGYRVIPVYSNAYENNGGIHCLVNVLD